MPLTSNPHTCSLAVCGVGVGGGGGGGGKKKSKLICLYLMISWVLVHVGKSETTQVA